jgi:hypothetical protein
LYSSKLKELIFEQISKFLFYSFFKNPRHFIYAAGVSAGVFILKKVNIIDFGIKSNSELAVASQSSAQTSSQTSSQTSGSSTSWFKSLFE